jgi:hypothetical protein
MKKNKGYYLEAKLIFYNTARGSTVTTSINVRNALYKVIKRHQDSLKAKEEVMKEGNYKVFKCKQLNKTSVSITRIN